MEPVVIDYKHLDELRRKYQASKEDVAQAWVEHWDAGPLAEARAARDEAGALWLTAIHAAAWPEISKSLVTK